MSEMRRLGLVVMLVGMSEAWAQGRPQPDVGSAITVPAVPPFEMMVPSAHALGVRQLKALGRRSYDGKSVTVRGYVTHVYDCVEENLEPFKTRAEIARAVAADPKRCEAPKLYLGDAKTMPRELSLRVADLPAGVAWRVGDYLEVAGTFAFVSPKGDKDREGLVAYASAQKVKPELPAKMALPPPHSVSSLKVPNPVRPTPPPGEKMKAIDAVLQDAREHIEWLQWKEAQAEYQRVVATWDGNDVVWYELGNAYDQPGVFTQAAEAYGRAFALVPSQPVYAYLYGRALWLRDYYAARVTEAKRRGIHEEFLELSLPEARVLAKLDLDKAQQMLEYAIKLAPDQWLAHASLASIYLAHEDHKAMAEELTKAIARGPKDYSPYWSLAKLYYAWGYNDEVIAVFDAWRSAPGIDASQTRPYEIAAKAYEAKRDIKKAIEMLSIILAHPGREIEDAALERARLYIATKQYDKARADLAAFPLHRQHKMREVNALLAKIPIAKKRR